MVYRLTILSLTLATATSVAVAQGRTNLQGTSGLLNVPDASVLEFGVASFAYDRQIDGPYSDDKLLNDAGTDTSVSAGIFPHLEIAGRNVTGTETGGPSDLSFNVKIQSPWQLVEGLDFAIGQIDLGGAANHFDTTYAAATWQWRGIRATLGAGKVSGRAADYTQRLDGVFGGLEYAPTDWLGVLVEDDGYSTNAGVRLSVPSKWLPEGWRISGLAMASAEEGVDQRQDWYGFNIQIPLANKQERTLPYEQVSKAGNQQSSVKTSHRASQSSSQSRSEGEGLGHTDQAIESLPLGTRLTSGPDFDQAESKSLQGSLSHHQPANSTTQRAIVKAMEDAGFERVRVRQTGPRWVIAFENHRYNANVVDGLAVAAGTVSQQIGGNEFFYLQLEKYGLPVFGLGGNAQAWRAFLTGQSALPPSEMVVAPRNELTRTTNWVTHAARSTWDYLDFRPTITIRPAISAAVGTEYGVLDYSLATRADLLLPLWQGASVNVTRDWSTYETEDYSEDGPLGGVFRSQTIEDGVKNKVFSQALRHGGGFTSMVSYGEFFGEYEGLQYEGRWEPGAGRHRFRVLAADFEELDFPGTYTEPLLASWRYFAERTNTELNVTTGTFLEGDEGFKVDLTQHIGNARLHITVKESDENTFAGLGFTIPLTPQRDMPRLAGVQVVGTPNFRFDVASLIGEDSNTLVFAPNRQPEQYYSLRNAYYNGDRLSPAYVRANQQRLRSAWQKYAPASSATD